MRTSEEAFLKTVGRPWTDEDAALVYVYDGVVDRIQFSTLGNLDNMNAVLAYAISEHIKHANESFGRDVTSDVLRAIFEGAKERLKKDGSN